MIAPFSLPSGPGFSNFRPIEIRPSVNLAARKTPPPSWSSRAAGGLSGPRDAMFLREVCSPWAASKDAGLDNMPLTGSQSFSFLLPSSFVFS